MFKKTVLVYINITPAAPLPTYYMVGDTLQELSFSSVSITHPVPVAAYVPNEPIRSVVLCYDDDAFNFIRNIKEDQSNGGKIRTDAVIADITVDCDYSERLPAIRLPVEISINPVDRHQSIFIQYTLNWINAGTEGVFFFDTRTFIDQAFGDGTKEDRWVLSPAKLLTPDEVLKAPDEWIWIENVAPAADRTFDSAYYKKSGVNPSGDTILFALGSLHNGLRLCDYGSIWVAYDYMPEDAQANLLQK